MSNMSYCRYRNTVEDLQDCSDAMFKETGVELGGMDQEEFDARNQIIRVCQEIVGNFTEVERDKDDNEGD